MLKIVLFFIFTKLIQINEKMHVQVTVCFPDMPLMKTYISIVFTNGMFS